MIQLLEKTKEFKDNRFEDGVDYLLGGVLPMALKYVSAFYNLVNYRDKKEVIIGMSKMYQIMTTIQDLNEDFCEFASNSKSTKVPDMFHWGNVYDHNDESQSAFDGSDKIEIAENMREYCEYMIKNIKIYYEGWPKYQEQVKEYLVISRKGFEKMQITTRYKEPIYDSILKER